MNRCTEKSLVLSPDAHRAEAGQEDYTSHVVVTAQLQELPRQPHT